MNIAMEQTEEYQNGVLKAKYGDAFIRGNNGAAPSQLASTTTQLSSTHSVLYVCYGLVLYISSVGGSR